MTESEIETFDISIPGVPPGFSALFRQRLRDLGSGNTVDRDRLAELCGSDSAANQFLAKASRMGALVPKAWGEYVVASEDTLQLISRIGHPAFRRFVSWSRHLPELAGEDVLFVAPYLWRETQLNVDRPMPLVGLDPDQDTLEGAPPQWEAFYMDVDETREWELVLGDEIAGSFATPGPLETALVMYASLDPRWRQAADAFSQDVGAGQPGEEMDRLHLEAAPRGQSSKSIGVGPPHRRRLLAPPWYIERVDERARRSALGEVGAGG